MVDLRNAVKVAALDAGSAPDEAAKVANITVDAIADDPALMNATGQERWWQSGVGFFGTGGVLWALGIIATQVATNGFNVQAYDFGTVVGALGALASAAGVLYRRYVPGLKPLFHTWFGVGR